MHRTFIALGCFALLALAVPAAAESGTGGGSGGATLGGKCTAKTSDGKTHSGTYTNDVDGLNCAGSWGSVNCTNHGTDSGLCKGASVVVPHHGTDTMTPTTKPQSY